MNGNKSLRLVISVVFVALSLSACNPESTEEYLIRGEQFSKAGEWNSAIIEFRNSVKREPENAMARAKLGQAYIEVANANAAIKELNRAIEYGYKRELLLIPLAKAYRQKGDFEKILDKIKLQEGHPSEIRADVLSFRGVAWIAKGETMAAVEALKKARNLGQDRTEVRLAWAILEKSRNNVEAQRAWLKPLLEREGGIADAWSQLGEIEQQANNLQAAELAYSKSIELRPYKHLDSIRRAMVRIALGNLDGAQDDVNVILKAGATWPVVQHANALIGLQKDQLDQAQSSLQDVLSRYPEYNPSRFMLALVYHRKGQYQSAIKQLEQYLARQPDEYRPNMLFADSLLKVGRTERAIKSLEQLNQNRPHDPRILAMLGRAYQRQGDTDQALGYLEQAIEHSRENTDLRLQLSSLLLEDPKRVEQGRIELQNLLKLSPANQKASQLLYLSYMREGKFTKALEIADFVEKQNPKSPLGINMSALTYYAAGKKEKTINMLETAVSKFPANGLSRINLARIYFQEGRLDKAKLLYEELLNQDNANIAVLTQLAMIAARDQKHEESLEWIKKAYDRNPGELSPKLLLASRYLRANEPVLAIEVLNTAESEQRDSVAYIMLQAQAKLALNEVRHAIRLLNKLVVNHPRLPTAHFLLAQSYAKNNEPIKMRESLVRSLDLNPKFLSAHLVLARLDLFEGKREDFKKRVNLLQEMYPNDRAVLLLAAKLDSTEQNYGQAIEKLSSLVEQKPHTEVIIDLSINQWNSGDRQGAISNLEFWIQEHGDDTRAMILLAQYYLGESRYEAARQLYKKIDKLLPDQPVVLNNLAWLLRDAKPEEGLKYAERALQISPKNPMILDTLGVLYLQAGDTTRALDVLEQAVKLAPNFIDIQINYAQVLAANNRKAEAKALLSKLISNASSGDQRKRLEKELSNI